MNHATNTAGTEFGYVHDYLHGRRPLDASLASVAASMLSMRLAVRAYLAWWQRDRDNAMRYAVEALDISEDCTLAAIVLAAFSRGILPRGQER